MFKIEWKEGAIRQIQKLPLLLSKRIYNKIDQLKDNPFSKDIKRLKNEESFRLRIGDYRVILDLNPKENLIMVLRIGHRKNIYNKW
jgi:mRNA interferase RelE/StbE